MTAFDTITVFQTADPDVESLVGTVTDGETYKSGKFKYVETVQATIQEDTTTLSIPLSIAISSSTITVHCTGLLDHKCAFSIRGH